MIDQRRSCYFRLKGWVARTSAYIAQTWLKYSLMHYMIGILDKNSVNQPQEYDDLTSKSNTKNKIFEGM